MSSYILTDISQTCLDVLEMSLIIHYIKFYRQLFKALLAQTRPA